ncbi:MAG TPA: hypothetical protein VLI05_07060 [Candidatus Saccharimonadia bacterium]|nr:hypothetical protein [Candidatus Saccharimonadia bacterium]
MKDNALYLEADEDITSAIDKLHKVAGEAVQIVVPKRSTMLQSIINLKLLKKAAADAGKELVLVTNDRVASDLAGRVGLAVAPSLGAKAVLTAAEAPEPPKAEDVIEADDPEPPQPDPTKADEPAPAPKKPLFARKSLGDKAAVSLAAVTEAGAPELASAAAADTVAVGPVPGPGPKLPNFGRLQRRLLWGGLAVVLVVGYFVAMYFLTSAKITLYAAGSKVAIDTSFTVDPSASKSDTAGAVLAGQVVTFSKDLSGSFTPTGSKDEGTKAGGTMTVVNNDTVPHDFVAGTHFQAPDGKQFITNTAVHVDAASASIVNHQPVIVAAKATVAVTATQNGDGYNEAAAKYTITGLPPDQQQYTYGQGAQMSGGTSKTVTVVTQVDVDKAKADLLAKDKSGGQTALDSHVPSGYQALSGTQQQTASNVSSSPSVDAEGTTATLSLKAVYTELAVKKTDYAAVVEAQEQKQIGAQNQIYDNGLSTAQLTPGPPEASGRQSFQLTTQAYDGLKLDKTQIADQLKGKRYGDASEAAGQLPGVQRVEISLWPAWVTRLPGRASQIHISIQVASQ